MTEFRPEQENQAEDERFDAALSAELGQLPLPDNVTAAVSPWRQAGRQITAGLILTTFQLNFFYLQYLLPAIGVLLLYLGFRTLRRQNRAFGLCFAIAAVGLPLHLLSLAAIATPLGLHSGFVTVLSWTNVGLDCLLLLAYRQALRRSCQELAHPPQADPLLALLVWYAACVFVVMSGLSQSWLLLLLLLLAYIAIIKALTRLNQQLDSWGYAVRAAGVALDEQRFILIYLAIVLALLLGGPMLSNKVIIPAQVSAAAGQSELRQELLELGFPSRVLADLSDGTVLDMEGAQAVVSLRERLHWIWHRGGYDHRATMEAETVWVRLPGQKMQVITWFSWETPPPRFWQEALAVNSSACKETEAERILPADVYGGRLLYEKNGQTYAADLTDLSWLDYNYQDFFGTAYDKSYLCAQVGYPQGAEHPRGYVSQTLTYEPDDVLLSATLYYCHQLRPLALPYRDSRDTLFSSGFIGFGEQKVQWQSHYANLRLETMETGPTGPNTY